jgi:hypothetical protein
MFVEQGVYKLFNQLLEAETLLAAGDDAKAQQVIAHVRSINPQTVRDFEDAGFRYLGLAHATSSLSSAMTRRESDGPMTALQEIGF